MNKDKIELSLIDLKLKETARIISLHSSCVGEPRRRLLDLGFVPNTKISISSKSPLGNPIAYSIRNTLVALRKDQAQLVLISKDTEEK